MWDIYDRVTSLQGLEVTLRAVPVLRSLADFRLAMTIMRDTKRLQILHGQYGSMVGLLISLCQCDVRILSLRGSDIYWRYGDPKDRAGGLIRIIMSWIGCLRSHAIIVMSRAMEERVRSWPFLGRKPIHIIVDPAGEMFWPTTIRDIACQLRKEPFVVLIASFAKKNPVKRLHLVAEAVELCHRAGMAVKLNFLSGMSRDEVRAAIEACNTVALSSTHEGWPNIVKEALLLGKPFVATEVGDLDRYAGVETRNRIVPARPLDFAMAWVDQIAAEFAARDCIDSMLGSFHPDVCALKHQLLYLSYVRSDP